MQRKWVEAWCLHLGKEKQPTTMKQKSGQIGPLAWCGFGRATPVSGPQGAFVWSFTGLGVLLLTAGDLLIAPGGVCEWGAMGL